MATLTQIDGTQRIVMGWYGSCDDDDCASFPLETQAVADVIEQVYEIHEDSTKPNIFLSWLYENQPSLTQSLTSLKCGHSYYIELKKHTTGDDIKSILIPELAIADASTTQERYVTTDDQCGGGGGGVANISFLNDSPSDNDDLRISIGADLTEINSLCTSNVWAYRIEKLNGETDESGTEVQGKTFASGDQDSVTVLSNYLSSADGGASWYKVYIQGYASDQTTAVTDEISENVFMGWPTPSLTINGTTCSQTEWTAGWQTDGIVNEIPHTNSHTNVDLITACQTKNISYLEYEGPGNDGIYGTLDDYYAGTSDINVATFDLSKYLISDMTMAPIQGNNIPADQNSWEYSIDGGAYSPFVPETTITDASRLQVRLSAKDGTGADWSPGNYSVDVIFGYKGMGDNPITYVSYVQVNAEVKDRTIEIESLVDLGNLTMEVRVNRTNVKKWRYKLIGPVTTSIFEDTTAETQGDLIVVSGGLTDGPGEYTVEVWGISFIDDEWKTVTPVVSEDVQMNWPAPVFQVTDTIDEGYEEESGPSAGNDELTITHNWVTEYKISMPNNTDDAWEIKRNGEDDDQYVTIPTIPTVYLTRNDQESVSADVSDVYILRLKAGLAHNGYDRAILVTGTAKDTSSIPLWSTTAEGQVSVKPPCCNGFPGGNTYDTDGTNSIGVPSESSAGLLLRCSGFDAGGAFCFNDGGAADFEDLYLVALHDVNGNIVGGDPQHGSVNVAGNFSSSKAVVYTPPTGLGYSGTCYRGFLQNKAGSGVNILTADPARNMPTVFGVE